MAFGTGFWNTYPGTDLHEIDLHYVLMQLLQLRKDMQQVVDSQAITFADPINWNITSQYPANQVVLDSNGDGYISRQPVPAGIPLSNSNYWTQIFSFNDIADRIRASIAVNAGTSATTPQALAENDLVWWQGDIYRALVAMPAGTAFIEGTNVERYTVDEKITDFIGQIGTVAADLAQEVQDREDEDTALQTAIGDEQQAREDADDTLDDKIDQEIQDRQAEDARIIELIQGSSLFINVKEYGAIGDGVADDTVALNRAFAAAEENKSTIWFPDGVYCITSNVRVYSNSRILFDNNAVLKVRRVTSGSFGPALCFGEYGNDNFANSYEGTHDVIIDNMQFDGGYDAEICTGTGHGGATIAVGACARITFSNCVFRNCYNDHYIDVAGSDAVTIENCKFYGGGYVGVLYSFEAINIDFMSSGGFPHYGVWDNQGTKNLKILNNLFDGFYGSSYALGNHSAGSSVGYLHNIDIIGNTFRDMSKCIRMLKTNEVKINNNSFDDVGQATEDSYGQPIRTINCNNMEINNNIFSNVTKYGPIKVDTSDGYSENITINDNQFYTIGSSGSNLNCIELTNASVFQVCNNVCKTVTSRFMTASGCRTGNISDNAGLDIATSLATPTAINLLSSSTNLSIMDNMFPDCTGDVVRVGGASNCVRRNNLQTTITAF